MTTKPKVYQFKVLNPRGIQKGVHILRHKDKVFYEGDVLKAPGDMPLEDATMMMDRGFLEAM